MRLTGLAPIRDLRQSHRMATPSDSTSSSSRVDFDSFPMIGGSINLLLAFVEDNGGAAAFEGLSTDDVKHRFVLPATAKTQQSICQQLHASGDKRIGRPCWFVSHAWKNTFLQLLEVSPRTFGHIITLSAISPPPLTPLTPISILRRLSATSSFSNPTAWTPSCG